MGNHWFFLVAGFRGEEAGGAAGDSAELTQLVDLVYNLAWFWKVDPEQMMSRPLDVLQDSLRNAQRIEAARAAG